MLVKDFDSTGEFTVSSQFMTNADTPFLAFNGLIEEPVDPRTGETISDDDKYDLPLLITDNPNLLIDDNNGNVFTPAYWYEFSGTDVFDPEAWSYIGIK